jgi:hypothetical protein
VTPRFVPLLLYIQRGCAICMYVRRSFERHDVDFEIRWLSHFSDILFVDQERAKALKATAPWLVVDDETLTGSPIPGH